MRRFVQPLLQQRLRAELWIESQSLGSPSSPIDHRLQTSFDAAERSSTRGGIRGSTARVRSGQRLAACTELKTTVRREPTERSGRAPRHAVPVAREHRGTSAHRTETYGWGSLT